MSFSEKFSRVKSDAYNLADESNLSIKFLVKIQLVI